MSRYISPEQWESRIKGLYPNLEMIEHIYNSKQKVKFRCKCGYEFERAVENLIYKEWTCKCNATKKLNVVPKNEIKNKNLNVVPTSNKKKTHQEFVEELQGRPIEPLEEYKNNSTKIKFKCLICSNEWFTMPKTILSGRGCPKCANKKQSEIRKGKAPINHELYKVQLGEDRERLRKWDEEKKKIHEEVDDYFNLTIDWEGTMTDFISSMK